MIGQIEEQFAPHPSTSGRAEGENLGKAYSCTKGGIRHGSHHLESVYWLHSDCWHGSPRCFMGWSNEGDKERAQVEKDAFNLTCKEAISNGQVNADIWCAEDWADLEGKRAMNACILKEHKHAMHIELQMALQDHKKSTEELLAWSGTPNQCWKAIQWCLQWQATSLCVTMHADSVLFCRRRGWNLTLNGPRLNPMLILQHRQLPRWGVGWQVLVVNHGNASHSASPPAPSKPVSVTCTNDPLSAPMDKDDTTPMPSPVVMPPQAQLVNPMSIISHVPEWSLGTLMHALGNDMVDNSTPPAPVIPPKADAILLVAAPPQGGKLLCHLRLTPSSLR